MIELTTAKSFIVRIYRVDTEDPHKLTGFVETMDGSESRTAFTSIGELAAVLSAGAQPNLSKLTTASQ